MLTITSISKPKRQGPRRGTGIIYPAGIQERYDISAVTRWRWEKAGRLPARDLFIGGVAEGWRPETIEASEKKAA